MPARPVTSSARIDPRIARVVNEAIASGEPIASAALIPHGDDIVAAARPHVGEQYVLGTRAPMAHASWSGPWDCAEFTSWCTYQATGILYGVRPRHDAVRADAYTGYWAEDARAAGEVVAVEAAMRIPGAMLLRVPGARRGGHIAISDGAGGTIEAHSSKRGVIEGQASGRHWDYGILIPGIEYNTSERGSTYSPPAVVYRVTAPLMRGPTIEKIQRALAGRRENLQPGTIDGVYGPQTAAAVADFQARAGLVPDGEAGPETLAALRLVTRPSRAAAGTSRRRSER